MLKNRMMILVVVCVLSGLGFIIHKATSKANTQTNQQTVSISVGHGGTLNAPNLGTQTPSQTEKKSFGITADVSTQDVKDWRIGVVLIF